MKSTLRSTWLVLATATVFSLGLVAALSPIATATPPGQGPCSHGNSNKPCRPDPQPGHGQDCDLHGNNGGVNEDHCSDATTADAATTADPTTGTSTDPTTETTETAPAPAPTPSTTSTTTTSSAGDTAPPVETIEITPTDAGSPTTQTVSVQLPRHAVAASTKDRSRPATTKSTTQASRAKPKPKAARKHHRKPRVNTPRIRKLGVLPFTP